MHRRYAIFVKFLDKSKKVAHNLIRVISYKYTMNSNYNKLYHIQIIMSDEN